MGNLEVSEKPISLVAEVRQLFDDPYQLDLTLQHHLVNQFQQKTLSDGTTITVPLPNAVTGNNFVVYAIEHQTGETGPSTIIYLSEVA